MKVFLKKNSPVGMLEIKHQPIKIIFSDYNFVNVLL